MIKIPKFVENIVLYSDMPFESIAYDICNPQDMRFSGMAFEGKLLLTGKLLDVLLPLFEEDAFGNAARVIDESKFNATAEKFKNLHFNYDGSLSDIKTIKEVVNTITAFMRETCDSLDEQDRARYIVNPWFLSAMFHGYSPKTIFMINGKLNFKSMSYFDTNKTVLNDGDIIPVEFKTQLRFLFNQNRKNFYEGCYLAYRRESHLIKRYILHVLRSYSLCQCIKSSGLISELPYPVLVNNLYNAVAEDQEDENDG